MDILAQVVSAWIGDGTPASPYRPQLSDDYPTVMWQDITGTETVRIIPPINALILEITTDDQTYQTIASDPEYLVISAEQVQPLDG